MSTAMGWPTHWMTQTGEGKFSCWKRMQASHDFMNKIYWSTILYFTLTRLWTTHSEWGLFLAAQKSSPCPYSYVCMKPIENVSFYCRVQSCWHWHWSFNFSILRLNVSIPTHVFVIATRCTDSQQSLEQCSTLQTLTFILPQVDTSREFNCQVLSSATASQLTSQLSGTVQCDCFTAHFSTVGYCPVRLLHSSLLNCRVLSSATASQLTSLQDAVCVLRNLSLLVYCVALSHKFLW